MQVTETSEASKLCVCIRIISGGDLAPSLGDENIFRGPRFLNDVIFEKISIFTPKNSDDFFSHPPGSSDFPFLFPDSPYLYRVKCHI